MNTHDIFVATESQLDSAANQPLPNSRKIYVTGSRSDLNVPMREISQADTPSNLAGEKNPPIFVYDYSGPYTDPAVKIDLRHGLALLREAWIAERGDTEHLPEKSSDYGCERLADPELSGMRFDLGRIPRCTKVGPNVSQMRYARKGIAIRENQRLDGLSEQLRRERFGAAIHNLAHFSR